MEKGKENKIKRASGWRLQEKKWGGDLKHVMVMGGGRGIRSGPS